MQKNEPAYQPPTTTEAPAAEVDASHVYTEAFWIGLEPDPLLTVSEWADQFRMLSSKTSAEPGRWRTDRTPYLREVQDCLSPQCPNPEIVFMKGAQVGGTECGNNWLGYIVDVTSGATMAIQPTVDLAKRNSKLRIDVMIDDCERLREKVKEKKQGKSTKEGDTILLKEFPGGVLVLTGANSAAGLRSLPCRFIFADEVDAYPADVEGEGDPVALAKARTRTFSRRKVFIVSTPTVDGKSRIQIAWEASDKRRYHVPCPHCDHFQWLKWENVVWPKGEPQKAQYRCESCRELIPEHHKDGMLARGRWVAESPGADECEKPIGFHLSALYSPLGWFSWADCAKQFISATKEGPEALKVFVNTVLGEVWKEKADSPDWKVLYDRRELYPTGIVPAACVFLTCGVDVQKDRIEYEIVGWGKGRQSWSVEYDVIMGDTSTEDVWKKLWNVTDRHYRSAKDAMFPFPIRMVAVDSSYNTNEVYNRVRLKSQDRVIAVKGNDTLGLLIGAASAVDVTVRGVRLKKGFRYYPVGVNLVKSELYGWLQLEKPADGQPFPPGYCHFPQYDEEAFKQLTAERLVTHKVKGFNRLIWEKHRDRNERLDCRVYARAAAALVGIDRLRDEDWDQLIADVGASQPPLAGAEYVAANELPGETGPELPPDPPPPAAPPAAPQRRKSRWL
jgi:phage terminase large subunit GpA-like protein